MFILLWKNHILNHKIKQIFFIYQKMAMCCEQLCFLRVSVRMLVIFKVSNFQHYFGYSCDCVCNRVRGKEESTNAIWMFAKRTLTY